MCTAGNTVSGFTKVPANSTADNELREMLDTESGAPHLPACVRGQQVLDAGSLIPLEVGGAGEIRSVDRTQARDREMQG